MNYRPQNELLPADSGGPIGPSIRNLPVIESTQPPAAKLLQYVQLVWSSHLRWWKLTVPLGLFLGCVAGAVSWFLIVPMYSADATLRIKQNAPFVVFPIDDQSQSFVSTQLQLFKTRAVLNTALTEIYNKAPEVAEKEDPVLWLQQGIRASVIANSELVKVKFTDPDPKLSKQVVQAVVNSYIDYHRFYAKGHDENVVRVLQDEKTRREKALAEHRKLVKEKSKKAIIREGGHPAVLVASPLKSIQDLLIQTEVDIEVAKAELHVAEQQVKDAQMDVSDSELATVAQSQPIFLEMKQTLGQLEAKLQQWEKIHLSPASMPRYQQLKRQHTELQKSLKEFVGRYQEEGRAAALAYMKSEQERRLEDLRSDVQAKETMKEYLKKRLGDEQKSEEIVQSDSNEETVEYEFALRELQRQETVYNRIAERIVELQTEQYAPARVELLDEPIKPIVPDGSPWVVVGGSGVIAFLVPLVLIVFVEHFLQRITDASRIKEQNLQVVGEIATLPKYLPASEPSGGPLSRQLTLFEESIDHLCNVVRLSPELSDTQAIAIVSAISGEGKTHVATQLAISLAKSVKEPVLLMETDFRSPDIASMLGFTSCEGLLDVLVDGRDLEETILTNVHPFLDVITAGKQYRDLHSVLQHRAISELFATLRTNYRYIIIDTPPILAAGEAILFANHADAALICARRGYSRISQVTQVRDRLIRARANPIGVILNGVSRRQYMHSYGSYAYVSK